MKQAYCIILLSIISALLNLANAQYTGTDSIRVTGVVFEQDSITYLPNSRITVNTRTFSSSEEGQFSFKALTGDILHFSHIGYKDAYIQIKDSMQYDDYILGVFLSRDTVVLSEVIVVPRYMDLVRMSKTMPLVITPDEAYAVNNVRISQKQALTQTPERMDAEMNQKMVLQEMRWSTIYKYQIPPDRTLGVNSENMALMSLFIPVTSNKIKYTGAAPLNRNEMDLILRIYKQQHQLSHP